jgi:hypothetical protein
VRFGFTRVQITDRSAPSALKDAAADEEG